MNGEGHNTLVLASGSPRRRELLGRLGIVFEVQPADLDESVRPDESAHVYVLRIATEKARHVAARRPQALVLAADTSVVLAGEVLGKPSDRAHALEMLRRLRGRDHQVLTAIALVSEDGEVRARVVTSTVRFRDASDEELSWYVAQDESLDKAGAYASQGIGGFLIARIDGSPTNVIGLPLVETLELLAEAGFRLPWSRR